MFYSILLSLAIGIITAVISLVIFMKWSSTYWERKKIPYIKPKGLINELNNPFREGMGFWNRKLYRRLKEQDHKFGGGYIFASPILIPIDVELIKAIMTKDFHHFIDRGMYHNEKDDPLSAHLFSIEGTKWRNLRAKLTPIFTSGKLKNMFKTFLDCGSQLEYAMTEYSSQIDPVDIKDAAARYTTDIIGSCAFGIDCNSFKDPDAEFRKFGKKIFQETAVETLIMCFAFCWPNIARSLGIKQVNPEAADFFMKAVNETVSYRENNNIKRKDFIQLMIDLKNELKDEEDKLTIEQLAAQAFVFYIAGFETSSTTMTFCIYELATNTNIQDKLRKEINEVLNRYNGEITYEAIKEMKYLQQVVDETLRKYPPLPCLNRICTENYKIPDTDLTIEKGTSVFISAWGLHHDPEFFPNPDTFDPERFSEKNKKSIIPYTYMPFGEGPRICIGLRFGLLQTKVGLATLIRNFKYTLNKKTLVPLKMDPYSFIMTTSGGIWVNVSKCK